MTQQEIDNPKMQQKNKIQFIHSAYNNNQEHNSPNYAVNALHPQNSLKPPL